MKYQTGIYDNDLVPGLRRLVTAIHEEGGIVVFQLAHSGRQSQKKLLAVQVVLRAWNTPCCS